MSSIEFNYILDKIASAHLIEEPFPHLEIRDLLNPEHWEALRTDDQVHFAPASDKDDLLEKLRERGYGIVPFPGFPRHKKGNTIQKDYSGHNKLMKTVDDKTRNALPEASEQRAFRLKRYESDFLQRLMAFLNSSAFFDALKKRFNIDCQTSGAFMALQKYLSHYMNSPHTDRSNKALTFLFNANVDDRVSHLPDMNLGLLRFKPEFQFCSQYWDTHPRIERLHVPWEWCDVAKRFSTNNSLLVFKPSTRTLHAIKMGSYPHHEFQRTHILGQMMIANARTNTNSGGHYKEILRKHNVFNL